MKLVQKNLFETKDKFIKICIRKQSKQQSIDRYNLINAIGDVRRISVLKYKASSNQQITESLNEKIDIFLTAGITFMLICSAAFANCKSKVNSILLILLLILRRYVLS